MSYKLGLILSMVITVMFFLLGGDMICLSSAYSDLDATSITVGYMIAKAARTDSEFISTLEDKYHIHFLTISPSNPVYGDVVDFVISRDYDPLILSNNLITLKASRSTVIGYYG